MNALQFRNRLGRVAGIADFGPAFGRPALRAIDTSWPPSFARADIAIGLIRWPGESMSKNGVSSSIR